MKLFITDHKTKTYEGKEILIGSDALQEDLDILKIKCLEKIDKTAKDEGSCCIGGGIKLKYFRKGKRKPNTLSFISNPFQGNVGSWMALKPVMEYLNKYFPIGFYYEEGMMD